MSVTDQTLLSEIQRATLEGTGDGGAIWPSGMWTSVEVVDYLNQRLQRFRVLTGLYWTRAETNLTLSQANQDPPSDWISTVFVAHRTGAVADAGTYVELPRLDRLELDFALPTWPAATGVPRGYYEVDGDTRTTYVAPIPTASGALERYYVSLGTTLDRSGVDIGVSDEFIPTLKYGVLAEMFGKVGPGHNPLLAQAAEARWQEGIAMGQLIAHEGWFAL